MVSALAVTMIRSDRAGSTFFFLSNAEGGLKNLL
jgi:hypothetical protein